MTLLDALVTTLSSCGHAGSNFPCEFLYLVLTKTQVTTGSCRHCDVRTRRTLDKLSILYYLCSHRLAKPIPGFSSQHEIDLLAVRLGRAICHGNTSTVLLYECCQSGSIINNNMELSKYIICNNNQDTFI